MRAAAEFNREIAHRYDADFFTVLFAKESHRSGLLGFLDSHDVRADGEFLADLLVDEILDLFDFFPAHRLEMDEVETQTVR